MAGVNTSFYKTVAVPLKTAASGAPMEELKLAILPESTGAPAQTNDMFMSTPATEATRSVPAQIETEAPVAPSSASLAQTAANSSLSAGVAGASGLSLILLGIPDGAKKALAEKIATLYNVPHISVGKLVSQEIASGSELGKIMQMARDNGATPSGPQVAGLIARRLKEEDCLKGFVLDAYSFDLAGSTLQQLTKDNDNLKAVNLSSTKNPFEVPALKDLEARGDFYTLEDTGDADSDSAILDAMAANFIAPETQDLGLFR